MNDEPLRGLIITLSIGEFMVTRRVPEEVLACAKCSRHTAQTVVGPMFDKVHSAWERAKGKGDANSV